MFTEQDIKEMKEDGLTDEEIEVLLDAGALAETIDIVPNDLEGFLREYEKRVPSGGIEGMRETIELIKKDPEFFQKLIALEMVMAAGVGETPIPKPEETFLTKLPDEEYKKVTSNFFKILADMPESDREEFMKLIANLTEEQKQDMVSRLSKQ